MKEYSEPELRWMRCQCQHKRQTEKMSKVRKDSGDNEGNESSEDRSQRKAPSRQAHGIRKFHHPVAN